MGAGELLGDLVAGVAATDDQHRPGRHVLRSAVLAAVELRDARVEALGDRRHTRDLERAGGDHDLVGLVAAVVELDQEAALPSTDGAHRAAQLDRQLEVARVGGEVGDDVVATGVAVRITGERPPREAVVASRREQPQ